MRTAPEARYCRCGGMVRVVTDPHGELVVDDEPVVGGPLIVNVDTVVLRLVKPSSSLGFYPHRCRYGRR